MRLERLAPTVLLATLRFWASSSGRTSPSRHSTLHFGVISDIERTVPLRWIDPARAGGQLPGDPTATITCRQDPNRQVVDITATITAIAQALGPRLTSRKPSRTWGRLRPEPPAAPGDTLANLHHDRGSAPPARPPDPGGGEP